jgi:hypothetical protein
MLKHNKPFIVTRNFVYLVIGAMIVCAAALFVYRVNQSAHNSGASVSPTPIVQLPASWSFVSTGGATTTIKVTKKTAEGIRPTVVFTKTAISVTDTTAYIQKLEKGVFFAIPSYVITGEKKSDTDEYTEITAQYMNGNRVVYVLQRVYIKPGVVETLTGSYGQPDTVLEKDIRDIFDLLQKIYGN